MAQKLFLSGPGSFRRTVCFRRTLFALRRNESDKVVDIV